MNLWTMLGTKTVHVVLIAALLGSVGACSEPSREIVAEAGSAKKDFLLGPEDVFDISPINSIEIIQSNLTTTTF